MTQTVLRLINASLTYENAFIPKEFQSKAFIHFQYLVCIVQPLAPSSSVVCQHIMNKRHDSWIQIHSTDQCVCVICSINYVVHHHSSVFEQQQQQQHSHCMFLRNSIYSINFLSNHNPAHINTTFHITLFVNDENTVIEVAFESAKL